MPSTLVWTRVASRLGCPLALILVYVAQAVGIVLPVVSGAWWAAAGSAVFFGGSAMGVVTLTYARETIGPRKAGLVIGQVSGPLVAAALVGGPKGFALALIAASSAVALGGLLMVAVWLFGATSTEGGKEYVYGNGH